MSDKVKRMTRYPSRIPIQDITALRNIVGKEDIYDYTILLGGGRVGDGNAAEYYWDANSTKSDSVPDIIKPTAIDGPGRWIKVKKDYLMSELMALMVMNVDFEGDGSTKKFTIAHNFKTKRVVVQVTTLGPTVSIPSVDMELVIERYTDTVDVIFNDPVPVGHKYVVMIIATELITT